MQNSDDTLNILFLDDSDADRELNMLALKDSGLQFSATEAVDEKEYLNALDEVNVESFDIVLSDFALPGYDGLAALKALQKRCPDIPFIIISGKIEEELAVEVLKQGATDYVFKNRLDRLPRAVERAIKEKKAEIELKQFKKTLDAALDCIFIFDTTGFNFSYVNQGAVNHVGYTRDELLNMTPADIQPEYDVEDFRKLVKPLMDGDRHALTFETVHCHKNGKRIPVEILLQLIAPRGEKARFVSVVRDITERRRAEKERIQLQKQLHDAQRMEAIGTLAGGIAHDFNNILAIIKGFSEIALNHELAEDHPARYSIEQVKIASERAIELVRQILTSSRKKKHVMTQIKITPIIKETVKLLRASLPATIKIQFEQMAPSDDILGDSGKFHQVLMNLCTNAAHAMQTRDGVLKIALKETDAASVAFNSQFDLASDSCLMLSVSDTGHGMAPSVMEHIFEPYFSTKSKEEGTGLGLSVTHGIVKAFGGDIRVTSKLDQGTVFKLYFPLIKGDTSLTGKHSERIPKGNEHILFVDDEEAVAVAGRRMLVHLGYTVTIKTNSSEALETFRSNPDDFDLVITDMTMPHLTGDRLARKLMYIRPEIPIILCTGYDKRLTLEKAKSLGVRDLLQKPVGWRDLAMAIRRALDSN
ncbi:response regulator [Desulfococcaceae bacterium HSG9]|nr:response regulator [Desulfococcaceae bacterium HSG9]